MSSAAVLPRSAVLRGPLQSKRMGVKQQMGYQRYSPISAGSSELCEWTLSYKTFMKRLADGETSYIHAEPSYNCIDRVSYLAREVCVTHTKEAGLPEYLQAQETVLALQRI